MSWEQDGVDDLITYPTAAGSAMNDALSIVWVGRILTTSDTAWLSFMEFEVGASNRCGLGRNNSGNLYFVNAAGTSSAVAANDSDNWAVYSVTRSTAAVTTFRKFPIGGSATGGTGGALADSLTAASGNLRIGGNDDFANIRSAAFAYWNGVTLSTAQLDGIATTKTTQAILDLSPTACYDDSDSFVSDLVGTMEPAVKVGGVDSADDPAGWVYLGGGAAEVIPDLVMARRAA